jgi:hypothetical protein
MLQKFIQSALLLVVLFTTVQSYAQVSQAPDGIQFQALATDANGHPAAGRVIYVKDAIIAKTATGTIVYSETFKVTASSAGVFSIVLGKGTYASGVSSIANIDWANGPFFLNLKIAVEPTVPNASWNVNNEYVDLGTSQFWSVPYALYAGNVKGADGKLNTSDTAAMLKPYFTAINLKANIESPTFTGTVSGITKEMVGLGNVDNTSDLDKPISTATQTALDLKANITDVNTSLALKANAADVTAALDLKVDKVTGKALSTNDYTTAEKTKLAAITGTNTGDQDLSALATNTALALKANTIDVNTALALKANAANVASSLATKADVVNVNNAIAAINTSLNTKADVVAVNNSVATLNASLATKENTSSKSVNITTDATSDTKYPSVKSVKTYVDVQVAAATIADADANTKGKIRLGGDLGGTAAAPTVPGLALKLDANQKGVANGVATLNAQGIIPSSQLPPVTLSSTNVVGSDVAMTALSSATVGSIAVRTDINKNYVLSALPASTLSNWVELLTPAAPVQAVNGYTGTVNLSKADLGLGGVDNTSDLNKPISIATQNALDLKANASDVVAALNQKANATDVASSLVLKANATDMASSLALKANVADMNTALASKATVAALAAAVLPKANATEVDQALNLKLDANKLGVPNGTASLNALGKIPTDQIPAISFSSVKVLGSQADMLALSSAVVGSVVIRTDVNKNYVLAATDPTVLANWIELLTPAPPVQTVNGYTGTVSLSKSDLGLSSVDNTSDASKPISTATQSALVLKADASSLAAVATSGSYTDLVNVPSTVSAASLSGIVPIANGGTGASTTAGAIANLGAENTSNKSTNLQTDAESTSKYPSVKLIKDYVDQSISSRAALDSPAFTGTPTAPTAATGTATTQLATTAFVKSAVEAPRNNFYIGVNENLGLGSFTSLPSQTGVRNTLIGNFTLQSKNAGDNTTALGHAAGNYFGSGTGLVTSVNKGLYLGAFARSNANNQTNEIVIGADALGNGSNTIQLGNTAITNTKTSGTLTAGAVTYPNAHGAANQVLTTTGSGTLTWSTVSGAANASSLSGTVGVANGGTGAATAAAARTNLGLVIGTDVQAPLVAGTDYLAPNGSAAGLTNFPVLNQNTTGNAATATKLAASKTINGVAFDGSSDITIAASASTLSGTVGVANGGTGATTAAAARTNLGLVIGTDVQAPLVAGTDFLAPTGSAAGLTNFPTFNQNTTGNAATATKLAASKTINGVAFDGSSDITIAATASTISGTVGIANGGTGAATAAAARTNLGLVIGTDVQAPLTAGTDYLAPTGSAAGLTNFPTFNQNTTGNAATATLATNATTATNVSGIVDGANGGTGVANSGKTITLGGNFQTSGGYALTLTTTATTNVTLPSSGTLATVQQLDAKAPLASPALTGTPTAPTAATADNSTKIATTEFVQAAVSAGNAGIRTIGAISSTSNAKGAVVSGTELVLTPADASNGGIITTGSQTFAGLKTFANNLSTNGTLTAGTVTYPNAHGTANQVLSTTGSGTLTWTTPSLASLTGYTNGSSPFNVGLGINTSASANGQFNTAVGVNAMQSNISSENTAIGYEAMRYISQASSNNNVVIGSQAAKYFGASGQWNPNNKAMYKSVYIGSLSRASNIDTNNEIVIGYDAVGNGSNTVRLGNTSITAVHTQGSFYANSVQLTSDYRLKKNIKPLENGISTVLKLKPVNYEKKNSLESSNYDKKENGFIAQEIQKVLPYIVDEGKDKDRLLSVDYTSIIPVLTKAIQEQQVIIEQLKSSNEANTIQLKKLLELVENLQKEKK